MKKYYEHSRKEWLSTPRIVAGVMTGTSLDGIDVAITRIDFSDKRYNIQLLGSHFEEYSSYLRDKIINIIEKKRPVSDAAEVNFEISNVYAKAIEYAASKINLQISSFDAIGIHGQTVWHNSKGGKTPSKIPTTLQIGNGSALSQILNVPVVSDFRSADVALGGEGAPLVPIFDNEFLRDDYIEVCALNIGGIANITLLPPRNSVKDIIAFDVGPGNMLIDAASLLFFGKKYDAGGLFAQDGITIPGLLKLCLEHPFIDKKPPKSTGREMFGRLFLEKSLGSIRLPATPGEDIIRTMTEFTAESIVRNIQRFGSSTKRVIASGGGIHNKVLMEILKKRLGDIELVTIESYNGIPSDYKEAMCFAYLAYRTLGGLTGNIPSVTGAARPAVLGSVSTP